MIVMRSALRPFLRPAPLLAATAGGVAITATLYTVQGRGRTMSASSQRSQGPTSWPTTTYKPRHASWPYKESDFARQDPSPDSDFYSSPRFVTHIDDAAISTLRDYYATVLPRKGLILDLCSSWISHYPPDVEEAASRGDVKVVGMGMNRAELNANKVLNHGRALVDLNEKPDVASALAQAGIDSQADEKNLIEASTMVVSVDYLTKPVEVLKSLREVTKDGGRVHLIISNRCFPTKVIARWSRVDEEERLSMVGDFLHFAGWKDIEIVELSNGTVANSSEEGYKDGLKGLMSFLGMNARDPLWVVRGTKG